MPYSPTTKNMIRLVDEALVHEHGSRKLHLEIELEDRSNEDPLGRDQIWRVNGHTFHLGLEALGLIALMVARMETLQRRDLRSRRKITEATHREHQSDGNHDGVHAQA
jgi:hypothetical protein